MSNTHLRQDARIIGLVALAHSVSHFYHLILAGLFPWIKLAFGLSYSELGLLMSVFFFISGVGQALAGFVVDRVGAHRVLFAGLALLGCSTLIMASAPSYAMLMVGSVVAGFGNAVFHPADYTLLNQRVSKERLAHAFSMHGVSGSLGWAAAPLFLAGVAALSSWRTALLAAAAIPFGVLLLLFLNRAVLRADPAPAPARSATKAGQPGSLAFLALPQIWMCFAFFFISSVALAGIQSFSTTSIVDMYGVSLATAASAYTAFMLASAGGTLAGGFLANRTRSHGRTVGAALALASLLALLLAAAVVPGPMAVVLMGGIGFATGLSGPSRDLLIRSAAPQGATGRVFGVVYSGLDSGLALGPLMFGAMMDAHHPSWLFIGVAVFYALAIVTVVGVGGSARAPAMQKA
jgi:FSR family fosmidomycin resistance protein-like MFS transporter